MPIQGSLDNVLDKPKEIGQICVLSRDYDPYAKSGFASIIPAGPAKDPLRSKYYEKYCFGVAPIMLSPDGRIEIYRKGELSGHGKVDLPREFIEETIRLAQNYVLKNWGEQFIIEPECQNFSGCDKYTDNMMRIWNNANWDFVDGWLEETIAITRTAYINQVFAQRNLLHSSQKRGTHIVLLKKDIAKGLNLIRNTAAN